MSARTVVEVIEPRLLLSAAVTVATPGGTLGSRVAVDAAGDVFGTTLATATSAGTVFEVPAGTHAARTVASFGSPGADNTLGIDPGDVLIDKAGNLFGDTPGGGTDEPPGSGGGTFWELPAGSTTIRLLYTFAGGNAAGALDDYDPQGPSSLVMDAAGDLFATASSIDRADLGVGPEVVEYVAATSSLTATLRSTVQDTAFEVSTVTADADGHTYALVPASGEADLVRLDAGQPPTVVGAFPYGVTTVPSFVAASPTGEAVVTTVGGPIDAFPAAASATGPVTPTVLAPAVGGDVVADPVVDSLGDVFAVTSATGAEPSATAMTGELIEVPVGRSVPVVLATFDARAAYQTAAELTLDADGDLFWAADHSVFELPAIANRPPPPGAPPVVVTPTPTPTPSPTPTPPPGIPPVVVTPSPTATPTSTPTPLPTDTSALRPAVARSTARTAIVAGTKARGVVTVTLVDAGAGTVRGADTVDLYAVTADHVATAGTLVGTARVGRAVTAGRPATVAVRVRPVRLPAGSYTLVPVVTDAAGGTSAAATGPALSVARAVADVSATVAAVRPAAVRARGAVVVTLVLANAGNVDATVTATATVHVTFGQAQGGLQLLNPTATRRLTVRAGVPRTIRLRVPVRVDTFGAPLPPPGVVTGTDASAVADTPFAAR